MNVKFYNHKTVLDIGAGSGTYSRLYANTLLPRSKFTWHAVEVWEPYVEKFGLRDMYDHVHITDALSFLKTNNEFFDVIFMGDVMEHMTKEQAQEVMEMAQQVSHLIIMSIPIVHYPQDEYEGNPYEAHVKDDWSTEEVLSSFDNIVSYGVENEIGVFILSGVSETVTSVLERVLAPKIGVYAICKNEAKFVTRFMKSITPADDIVICDTGSTDGTYDMIMDWLKWFNENDNDVIERLKLSKISVMPFRFDDARNAAMMQLRPDLDICVSIDFDELMQEGWYEILTDEVNKDLRERGYVLDRYYHRFMTHWNWDTQDAPVTSEHWHERIHSRNNYLWKLPVHEVLVKSGEPEESKWLGGLTMIQKPDNAKPRSSYMAMLEISVKEDPKRWKSWSFLAGDYMNAGRYEDAIAAVNKAKACPGADQAFLCNQLSRFHQTKGFIREAIAEMTNAAMAAPHLREYKVYVARLYLGNGDPISAAPWIAMADTIKDRTYGYEYDASVWGEQFDNLKASIEAVK